MLGELEIERLAGPPPGWFDCGRDEQNLFLHDRAWPDQQALLSTTYLLTYDAVITGYVTVCMSGIALDRRERGPAIRYQDVSALKLAQLGVDRAYQGRGIGHDAVSFTIDLAQWLGRQAGCRYVILDAQPDLEGWYGRIGFTRNLLQQERRILDAVSHRRDPERIAVSMRYDLRRAA
jgi:GNAT superfamily N-acetyltransferase